MAERTECPKGSEQGSDPVRGGLLRLHWFIVEETGIHTQKDFEEDDDAMPGT